MTNTSSVDGINLEPFLPPVDLVLRAAQKEDIKSHAEILGTFCHALVQTGMPEELIRELVVDFSGGTVRVEIDDE